MFQDAKNTLQSEGIPYDFTLTARKIAIRTAQRRLILKVQNPAEVPISTKKYPFL
jgi:hypothetical protein